MRDGETARTQALEELLERFISARDSLLREAVPGEPEELFPVFLEVFHRFLRSAHSRLGTWEAERQQLAWTHELGEALVPLEKAEPSQEVLAWGFEQAQPSLLPLEGQGALAGLQWGLVPLPGEPATRRMCLCLHRQDHSFAAVLLPDLLRTLFRLAGVVYAYRLAAHRAEAERSAFENILENVPHAMLAIDLDDRITALNANFEYLFGLRRLDVLEEDFHAVLPRNLAEIIESLMLRTLRGGATEDLGSEHTLPSGSKLQIGISASPIMVPHSDPTGVVLLFQDLSLSREVMKLRELDEMKSDFVHTVTHDLKTPLAALMGAFELLEPELEELAPAHAELVRLAQRSAERLQNLVYDILELSRLESGKLQLLPSRVRLGRLVEAAVDSVQSPGSIRIETDIPPDLPAVRVDPAKIREVFDNLLTNAVSYSPEGGTVRIEAERGPKGFVTLRVIDQGMGIASKDLDRIFEKFFRAPDVVRSAIDGTGLGLAIVRHILKLHGGRIEARSEPGEGTTMMFTLPVAG